MYVLLTLYLFLTDLEWPEGDEALSSNMQNAIDKLLTLEPEQRPGWEEVKIMPLFKSVDWDGILQQQAPFVPEPTSSTDTAYFEGEHV